MKKNMKKKGFTLIELIAVIAILAILGAVLVPRIGGYMDKANKSNLQTSAKTIVHAIQAYNADATPRVAATASTNGLAVLDGDSVLTAVDVVNNANPSMINKSNASYTNLAGLTVAQLVSVSNGKFTYAAGVLSATQVPTDGSILD